MRPRLRATGCSAMTTAHLCATTHTGVVRSGNEDAYAGTGLLVSRVDGEVVSVSVARFPILAVVADGLGGHASGNIASALAVAHVFAAKPGDGAALVNAVHNANQVIVDAMRLKPTSRGMGSTIAAVLLHAKGLAVVNVGDSPVLELIGERVVQLSIDDVAPDGGLPGVRSFALTQALGGQHTLRNITPHLYEDQVEEHRRILLCTDGLTNFVPRRAIVDALRREDPRLAVGGLLQLALESGGADNVTCMLVDVGQLPAPQPVDAADR